MCSAIAMNKEILLTYSLTCLHTYSQGSQEDKVKFQDQLSTKFQDIFWPQAAKYT